MRSTIVNTVITKQIFITQSCQLAWLYLQPKKRLSYSWKTKYFRLDRFIKMQRVMWFNREKGKIVITKENTVILSNVKKYLHPERHNSSIQPNWVFSLLSASLKLLSAFFCLINEGKTSAAGRWDNPGQCTRIISRPQQEQRPAALSHSALHHVWPSACQAPAPSRSPPGTDTQK